MCPLRRTPSGRSIIARTKGVRPENGSTPCLRTIVKVYTCPFPDVSVHSGDCPHDVQSVFGGNCVCPQSGHFCMMSLPWAAASKYSRSIGPGSMGPRVQGWSSIMSINAGPFLILWSRYKKVTLRSQLLERVHNQELEILRRGHGAGVLLQ